MKTAFFVSLLLLAVVVCAKLRRDPNQANLITSLPGWQISTAYSMYSGYISFTGKNYFYWFVQSPNTATDPLVLWLNGGPGCSSLGGLFTENGPFKVLPNNTLIANPFAWNLNANMLYLESPAGVGFSNYPGHEDDFFSDNSTAADNYQFLTLWLQQYSQFQQRRFYITGESYAGHYIPELVALIVENPLPVNFGGFMVGNPSTTPDDSGPSLDTYLATHGLTSQTGQGNDWNQLNPYDILVNTAPDCSPVALLDYIRFPHRWNNYTYEPLSNYIKVPKRARDVPTVNPCQMQITTTYLNLPEVQDAIHANATSWVDCGGPPYTGRVNNIVPYYQSFIDNTSLVIVVYSGDEDTVVNFIGTEQWIYSLNRKTLDEWGSWSFSTPGVQYAQIGGFGIDFDRISYRTVKGAGHMVPMYQPAAALQLFRTFLDNAGSGHI